MKSDAERLAHLQAAITYLVNIQVKRSANGTFFDGYDSAVGVLLDEASLDYQLVLAGRWDAVWEKLSG